LDSAKRFYQSLDLRAITQTRDVRIGLVASTPEWRQVFHAGQED
jgi:hypothetical protein